MTPEVLVVDDNSDAAENYARLIEARAKIGTISTSDANDAEQLLAKHPIKVVVLDQKMPGMAGTTLFQKLRSVNGSFRAVMLTGEADADEIGEALRMGYSDYLHKSKVGELPGVIVNELLKFHLDSVQKESGTEHRLIMSNRSWNLLRPVATRVYLLSSIVLDEQYVPEDDWKTPLQIKAGESQKFTDKITMSKKIKLDSTSEQKLSASLSTGKGLSQLLAAKLEAHITEKYGSEFSASNQVESVVERNYALPKEPEKYDTNYVVSRSYQRTQVWRRIQAFLKITCSCCGRDELTSVIVMQPTGEIATQHIEHLLRGERRVIPTGIHRF